MALSHSLQFSFESAIHADNVRIALLEAINWIHNQKSRFISHDISHSKHYTRTRRTQSKPIVIYHRICRQTWITTKISLVWFSAAILVKCFPVFVHRVLQATVFDSQLNWIEWIYRCRSQATKLNSRQIFDRLRCQLSILVSDSMHMRIETKVTAWATPSSIVNYIIGKSSSFTIISLCTFGNRIDLFAFSYSGVHP